ncbi:MAG: Dabb family protein [Rhodanobacter sp.]
MKLNDQNDRDEALVRLRALSGKIPTLLSLTCGTEALHSGDSAMHAFDLVLVTEHADAAGLTAYQEHPAHQDFANWVLPRRLARAVVDTANFAPQP